MTPTEIVRLWVKRFNEGDVEGLCALYHIDAVNHQVVTEPFIGRSAIRRLFETEFNRAQMVCRPVMIHEAGAWAILEWRDPLGLQGCGFFHVVDDQIIFQRGYFDQLTFFRLQDLPVSERYIN